MLTQIKYRCHEPLDGMYEDGIRHRIVIPAFSEFNSSKWDRELLIGSSDEDEKLAYEIVTAVNEHLFALAVQAAKE